MRRSTSAGALGSLLLALAAPAIASAAPTTATARVDATPSGRSQLELGVTHTQYSLDRSGDPAAVRRGTRLVRGVASYQNQHLYGWGTRNPNPGPGRYDWRTLDRRVRLMRAIGVTPVITLCCAPDWMTELGTETSRYPNVPPLPEHDGDFADLAARVARRYPDVRHFMVWNEMKGFFDPARNRWDVERYTELYNRVYTALKAVDPRIQVGGPYLVIEGTGSGASGYATSEPVTARDREVLDYWLRNKAGADFLAVDRKTVSSSHDRTAYAHTEAFRLTRWFGSVTEQLRGMTDLPVWFAEDYFRDDPDWRFQAAGLAAMLREELLAGASVSLRWSAQGRAGGAFGGNAQNWFSDTRRRGGGRPFPAYAVYRAFRRHFPPGTRLFDVRTGSSLLRGVASPKVVLLINGRGSAVRVRLHGRTVALAPHAVRVVAR